MDFQTYSANIVMPIFLGDYDEYLDGIIQTCQARKRDMAPKIWEYQVGERVKFVNVRPKYLNGAVGTIKKINRTKVVVDLDERRERFYHNITTPLTMIEKV